ncbi:MAG: hypothetical protein J6V09_05830 [Clostridia bacterium]|nr:hypothetical protein [Clostridia bacterium]
MQNNGKNSSDSIAEIINMIKADTDSRHVDEFVFGGEEQRPNLIFDDSDEVELPEPAPNTVTVTAEPEEVPVELFVPEKFEVSEKYDTPSVTEEVPRIYTTYVPRFTEASEKYRMKNDPRPVLTNENVAEASFESPELDPTAEIYESVDLIADEPCEEVIIPEQEKPKENSSASQVFKFKQDDDCTEETEVAEAPTAEPIPDPIPEPEDREEEITTAPDDLFDEEKSYFIPDPVDPQPTATVVYDAGINAMAVEDAPADVGYGDHTKAKKKSEYVAYSQRDSIKDGFLDRIMSLRLRFFSALAVTALLLVLECAAAFGVNISEVLGLQSLPFAAALLDLQFVVCLYLITIPETVLAFKRLFKKQATPELFISASFLMLVLYTVIVSVTWSSEYPLFGLIFAVLVLASIGAAYFKRTADFISFKLVAQNGEKKIIDTRLTRTLERENAALDGAIEEHKSKISRTFRTVFVSDFFKTADRCAENSYNVLFILICGLSAALVTATVAYFVLGGIVNAFATFLVVFMLSLPAVSLMTHKLPFYRSSLEALSESNAAIGERSLLEASETDVFTFEDTEVFGEEDVTVQRIMLYGKSENLTKALRQMSALFMKVGGPLDKLFSNSLDRKCAPATSVRVEAAGISGMLDEIEVLAGTREYMIEKGATMPREENYHHDAVSESTKIIYAAENGEVYAKFYIRYSFSEEFSMLIPTLEDYKIKTLVYTRDPNVTTELIKALTRSTDKIRVLRHTNPYGTDDPIYRSVSAGLVSFGDKMDAVNMIVMAKRYARLQSRMAFTELVAMAVGAVLAAALALGGMIAVPAIVLALWHAAWCGALHIISAREFRALKK